MSHSTQESIGKCYIRLPVHERPGYVSQFATTAPLATHPVYLDIPDILITQDDRMLDTYDKDRMKTVGNAADPVQLYYGHPDVQADILANERANKRLEVSKPHVYEALRSGDRIRDIVTVTPIVSGHDLIPEAEAEIFLKLDNIEANHRSFKLRGAANAILQLSDEEQRHGVAAFSAGNHALGVAAVANRLGIPAHIFMAETASPVKVDGVRELGATVILDGKNVGQAQAACCSMLEEHPEWTFIHPYDNEAVMNGQSSWSAEVFAQLPSDVTTVFMPIGGGGFISKNAAALKQAYPGIEIVGVQLEGSNAAKLSKAAGKIITIAHANPMSDGTAVTAPGKSALPYLIDCVDRIVTVNDRELAQMMVNFQSVYDMPAEAAGLLAATAARKESKRLSGKVVASVSGGNVSKASMQRARELVNS